jgi:Domain of unknown function DUF29
MDTLLQPTDRALYEMDEHAWIARQIDALRSGRLDQLDRDTLVEYLTEMTIRDQRELRSRFAVLLQHLLKIRFQPERHTRGWSLPVVEQQRQIRHMLAAIPSLAVQRHALFAGAYDDAVARTAADTGIEVVAFPRESPWTADAALVYVPPEPTPRMPWRRAPRREPRR